ncbi:unnamed protein product [Closterium sp. Yama58-4]|nr:unnamed protein product [Closterium sp. Yama58-4]
MQLDTPPRRSPASTCAPAHSPLLPLVSLLLTILPHPLLPPLSPFPPPPLYPLSFTLPPYLYSTPCPPRSPLSSSLFPAHPPLLNPPCHLLPSRTPSFHSPPPSLGPSPPLSSHLPSVLLSIRRGTSGHVQHKPEALRVYVEEVGGVGLTDTTLPHVAASSCKSPPRHRIAPLSTKRAHCSGPLQVEGLRVVGGAIAPSLISSSTLSPLRPSLVPFSPLSSPPPLLPLASPPPLSQPLLPSLIPSSHCSSTPSISDPVLPSLIPCSPIPSPL